MRWLLAIALIPLAATPLSAQLVLNKGDTLRWVQVGKTTGELQTPMGSQPLNMEIRTRFSLISLGGDSAATWMDSLTMNPAVPVMGAPLEALRGVRMILHFLPDGRVRFGDTKAAFDIVGITQISGSMWAFVLPKRGELQRGATWSDTTSIRVDTLDTTVNVNTITRFEVVGDSTYQNLPVVVLATTTTNTVSMTGGTLAMSAKGEGTGRAYYARSLGVIVYQTASMQVNQDTQVGDMVMQGRNRIETITNLVRR